MTMTECFHSLSSSVGYPKFEDRLYQALYDGDVSAWGRLWANGPYQLIEKEYWKVGRFKWETIGPQGTERASCGESRDYIGIRFNSAQIQKLTTSAII
jgi:hypothetical protein